MTYSDEVLMAYADGELDPAQCAEIEAAMTREPELARRAESFRALRGRVQAAFEPVLTETMPAALIEAVRPARTEDRRSSTVVPLRRRPLIKGPWRQGFALAASFVLGALAWHFASLQSSSDWIVQSAGRLRAGGALASALTSQLASAQSPKDPVQVGLTFESKAGSYCRTFTAREAGGVAGLACREGEAWTLEVLARSEAPPTASSSFRQAGSALPTSVLQAAQSMISGEPLDTEAEAAARSHGWKAPRAPTP